MATVSPASEQSSKADVGARVHAKAHFAVGDRPARQSYWSRWNTALVFGTVLEVHVDDSGKHRNLFLDVMWDTLYEPKPRRVNDRRVHFGNAVEETATPIADSAAGSWRLHCCRR